MVASTQLYGGTFGRQSTAGGWTSAALSDRLSSSMKRRTFIRSGLATLGSAPFIGGWQSRRADEGTYSISILGDTHFDAAPQSVYHGKWKPRHKNDWRDRQNEFKRNQEMWATRVPRLIAAAAKTRRPDTACLFQMGDLIQGDCSDFDTHLRFFKDAQAACSKGFGDLPFLTVCGNHDIRGGGDKAFDAYILPIASRVIGKPVTSANFPFFKGPDAYLFIDFMRPDSGKIRSMLAESNGARHTFIVLHSTIAPDDGWGPYWFLFGKPEDSELRRSLFSQLMRRRAIVLCGHIHRTQIRRWVRPEGELVEFSANSVWRPSEDTPKVLCDNPEQFGTYVKAHPSPMNEDHDGCLQKRTVPELLALMEEYRPGLVQYRRLAAAGHYLLHVSDKHVDVDFYACDSLAPSERFSLA